MGLFIFNGISPIPPLDWLVLSCASPCAYKRSAHHPYESGELTQCAKGNMDGAMVKQWEMDWDEAFLQVKAKLDRGGGEVFEELRERIEERRLAKEG